MTMMDKFMQWDREAKAIYQVLKELRASGWSVAVHNDYMQNGHPNTFWLFTRGQFAVRGEGATDYEALRRVQLEIANLTARFSEGKVSPLNPPPAQSS